MPWITVCIMTDMYLSFRKSFQLKLWTKSLLWRPKDIYLWIMSHRNYMYCLSELAKWQQRYNNNLQQIREWKRNMLFYSWHIVGLAYKKYLSWMNFILSLKYETSTGTGQTTVLANKFTKTHFNWSRNYMTLDKSVCV